MKYPFGVDIDLQNNKLLNVPGLTDNAGALLGSFVPTTPGPGYQLAVLPDGSVGWIEEFSLPDLTWNTNTNAGNWYKNVRSGANGDNVSIVYTNTGDETSLVSQPNGSGGDGRFFRTEGITRAGAVVRRFCTGARLACPNQFTSSSYIRGGWGFVTGEDGNGDSAPNAGGDWAAINFDRTPGNVIGLYATTAKAGVENRVLLATPTLGRPFWCFSTQLVNGDYFYEAIDTVTKQRFTHTESNSTYKPATGNRLAPGGWTRRMAGGNADRVIFYNTLAFKYSS